MSKIDDLEEALGKENSRLKKLIEENTRLTETIFEKTSKERIDELIDITNKRNNELHQVIDAINSELGTSINFNNIEDGLSKLKESIKSANDDIKALTDAHDNIISKKQEELDNIKVELSNTGKTKAEISLLKKQKAEKEKEIKDENKTFKDTLKAKNEILQQNNKAFKLLDETSTKYYEAANTSQKELNKRVVEGTTFLDDFSEKFEQRTRALKKGISEIGGGANKIYSSIKNSLEPWSKANQESMNYARTMGMSQKTAEAFLSKTVSWAAKNDIGLLFNKTTDELIKMQSKYSEVLGRNVQLTSEQKMDMLAMEKFLGEEGMMDIANNLENMGMGMSDSASFIKKTLDEATKTGVAASKLTKTIRDNIKMAQNYTFKDGLEGLSNMARKAVELKTDMSFVDSFINKVSTVEGAITTGAQLQVLGGNYAMGSDPLSMLYESLNDAEGLFDRAVGMAQGKVFYNEATGNFEMGAMDRYMMKQAATSMGISPDKMIDVAFRNASLEKIEAQASLNSNISNDKDLMEMVKNLATFNNGKAVINIGGQDKEVSGITKEDKVVLEAMQRTDSQNLQDMAINLRSVNEIVSGIQKETNNEQANIVSGLGENISKILAANNEISDNVAKIAAWYNIVSNVATGIAGLFTILNGSIRAVKGFGNLFGGKVPNTTVTPKPSTSSNKPTGGNFSSSIRNSWRGMRGNVITSNTSNVQWRSVGGGRFVDVSNPSKTLSGSAARSMINGSSPVKLGALAKTIKFGGSGLLSGALSLGVDAFSGELKRDTGGSVGRATGAAIGGAIGTVFGPIGTMVGSWLGRTVTSAIQDAQRENRGKLRKEIADKLSATLPQVASLFEGENALQGNYNKRDLKSIEKALSDKKLDENELSYWQIRKLRNNGDLIRMRDAGIDVRIEMGDGGIINTHNNRTSSSMSNLKYYANGGVLNNENSNDYSSVSNIVNYANGGIIRNHNTNNSSNSINSNIFNERLYANGGILNTNSNTNNFNTQNEKWFKDGGIINHHLSNNSNTSSAFSKNSSVFNGLNSISDIKNYGNGGILNNSSNNVNSITNTYASGGKLEGKSHADGGMPILGSNIVVEGGEYVINKRATAANLPLLEQINKGQYEMQAKEPLGEQLSVNKTTNTYENRNSYQNSKVNIEPISINLSGVIKLDTGNNQFDISNEILNNPQLLTRLTEMINKQLNILDNGSYNKGVFQQKFI